MVTRYILSEQYQHPFKPKSPNKLNQPEFIISAKYPGGLPSTAATAAGSLAAATTLALAPGAGPLLADSARQLAAAPIVLTGLSLRFAQTAGLGDLYSRMRDSSELQSAAPFTRWDVDAVYDPSAAAVGSSGGGASSARVSTCWGTFVSDVHAFDAAAFGISQSEAALVDPQTRLLLEHTAAAAAASGRGPSALSGAAAGVFVGCIWLEHAELLAHHRAPGSSGVVTGNGLAFMAGRISYTLGLTGPCIPTNTACSSSLVANHLAAAAVRAGECAFAAAAGANAMLLPLGATAAMTKVQALSPDGRCKVFGAEADGYGRGEGFAVAILETAATAAPGAALALLAGSAVNQDGRSSGLTAPNGPSQAALVAAAMAQAGVSGLDAVASHGTGTPLGDPIETGALTKAMRPGAVVTITAVKATTGHLEGTAGLAGLAQALVALRQAAALPLRYRTINPYVASSLEGWGGHCR